MPDARLAPFREEISFLRADLTARAAEIGRRDHFIAGLVEQVRELPASTVEASS